MITIEEIKKQEERFQFDKFDNETALEIGWMLVEMARERELPVSIDITRNRQQLFHAAMPGTAADNDKWLMRKANCVYNFGYSSLITQQKVEAKGISLSEVWGLPSDQYAPSGGSFPVNLKGTGLIGTITVSGLASHEDHGMVVECLEKYLGK